MPNKGWITTNLGAVTAWRSGGTPRLNNSEYWDGDIPWISASSMKDKWLSDSERRITPAGLEAGSALAKKGTVLLLVRGSELHKRIPSGISARDVAFNQDVKALPTSGGLTADYLYYWLRANEDFILRKVETTGIGAGKLDTELMKGLEISFPENAKEQESVISSLKALDDKIDLNRRLCATLETMARALFKSWFVDFEPVRAKAAGKKTGLPKEIEKLFPDRLVKTKLGEVPEGWSFKSVYEIAEYINGASYKAFEPNDDRRGYPIVKIAELKSRVTNKTKFSDVNMPKKYVINSGDVLFSWSGNPDTSIDVFIWGHGPAYLNQHVFKVVPNRAGERSLVIQTLRNLKPTFAEIARNKQTTGLGHVTVADLKRLHVAWPAPEFADAWNLVAEDLFKRSAGAEIENVALAKRRNNLLPKMMSGELVVGGY